MIVSTTLFKRKDATKQLQLYLNTSLANKESIKKKGKDKTKTSSSK